MSIESVRAFFGGLLKVSIRTKIMGIVAVCVLWAASALVWQEYQNVSTALKQELTQRGVAIGTGLATQSVEPILTDRQFTLHRLVRDTIDVDPDLIYAFVVDEDGDYLVHTFDGGFPADLTHPADQADPGPYAVQLLSSGDDTIQDIGVPIQDGKLGEIHVGMSEASINARIEEHVRTILIWAGLILALGLALAYGLASILTEPITLLAEATRAIGRGDFRWNIPVWARDEIGSLGRAFSEMSRQLRVKEEMRVQLLGKIIGAQEEERCRIARELHDETSQALTSLMVGLKYIEDQTDSPPIRQKTVMLRELAANTMDEVRHLATELRPSILDDMGLPAALDRYVQDYALQHRIEVDLHMDGEDSYRLQSNVEVAVFRIVQEALTNIGKYAEARNVSVVLRYGEDSMVTIVEDDGCGFYADEEMRLANKKRLGIFGMYERASLIGGKLTIESQPGIGTTVFLEVPVEHAIEVSHAKDKTAAGR